jgi:hypothetical protein
MSPALDAGRDMRRTLGRARIAFAASGCYDGTVELDTDGSSYLRTIELGASSDTKQQIRIFEQVGGAIPSSPQYTGEAAVLGPILLFTTSDNIASRKYVSFVLETYFGNFMLSISTSKYYDDRPDSRLVGILQKR